jgi:hypothetical protein
VEAVPGEFLSVDVVADIAGPRGLIDDVGDETGQVLLRMVKVLAAVQKRDIVAAGERGQFAVMALVEQGGIRVEHGPQPRGRVAVLVAYRAEVVPRARTTPGSSGWWT